MYNGKNGNIMGIKIGIKWECNGNKDGNILGNTMGEPNGNKRESNGNKMGI